MSTKRKPCIHCNSALRKSNIISGNGDHSTGMALSALPAAMGVGKSGSFSRGFAVLRKQQRRAELALERYRASLSSCSAEVVQLKESGVPQLCPAKALAACGAYATLVLLLSSKGSWGWIDRVWVVG